MNAGPSEIIDSFEHNATGDLDQWELGGETCARARKDNRSDGLYASLTDPEQELLGRFDPKEEIRAAAWNDDGDQTTWTARVHQSGDCISIPERQRRALDLEAGDRIFWGVAPLGAPDPDPVPAPEPETSSAEVATDERPLNELLREASEDENQRTLPTASWREPTSKQQEQLRKDIKERVGEARFREEMDLRHIAGVLEDVLADVSELSRFDD